MARDISFDLIQKNSQRLATLEVRLDSNYSDRSAWKKFITEGLGNTPLMTCCSLKILKDPSPSRTAQLELKSPPGCRRIRHLEMEGLPFSIVKEFCQPSLVTLSITYGEEDVSISALLSVLSTLSSLEELSVYPPNSFPTNPITENSETGPKDALLPHLASLRLSSDLIGSDILLDHLVIPSTTYYEIEIGAKDPTKFLKALERKLQGIKTIGERPPLKCGQLTSPRYDGDTMVWRAWTTDVKFEGEFLPEDTPLLYIRLSDKYDDFRAGVVSFFSNLVLSEVKTLHVIHARRIFTSDSWHSFFTLTPNVQDLYVTGSSTGLRRIFQAMRPEAEPEEAETILLPQIHTLTVGYGARQSTHEAVQRVVKELGSTLKARIPFHSTIQKFAISGLLSKCKMERFEALGKWVDSIVKLSAERDWVLYHYNFDSSSESEDKKEDD
ncbi:hypothetical protein NLI96_g9276 [Meripilus lineatus]|uniref:PH domain-containing protein n=1 Tax=Meripilus lineatus TaxID=2056292 RepID=A0AAD5UVQ7_9APHY|nr:hypothetical protein NLI96_g9276 [Physisporinus lineatus]